MPEKTPKGRENEPSPIQDKEVVREFAFTCTNCQFRGDLTTDPDWNWIHTPRGYKWKETDRYPNRCKECEKIKKRFQRMKRAIQKLYDITFNKYRTYGYPKMMTVGLPSQWNDTRSKNEQIMELKKKFRILRKDLLNYQIEGGVFSVECTQKVRFENDIYGEEKYHAHIHAVVIMPWIPPKALPDFCAIGLKHGLGRMNIKGKTNGDYDRPMDYKSHLASYLSKYITKEGVNGRSSRWGAMMKSIPRKLKESECSTTDKRLEKKTGTSNNT